MANAYLIEVMHKPGGNRRLTQQRVDRPQRFLPSGARFPRCWFNGGHMP